jgi:hypothetical protein
MIAYISHPSGAKVLFIIAKGQFITTAEAGSFLDDMLMLLQ